MKHKHHLILTLLLFFSSISLVQAQAEYGILLEISKTSFLPATIYSGDIVNLAVDVKNRGSYIAIVDLNATLDIGDQFIGIHLGESIEYIRPGSTKTLVFSFQVREDTLPGYYPVFLTMTYLRIDSILKHTETISVPVSKTEKNIDITVEPRVINPGKQTPVVFTLKNIGGIPVSNISFSWTEENGLVLPLGSDNKRYISILNANEQVEVSYIVAADPNITPGLYPLEITVNFTDVNAMRTQTSLVGLMVGGTTNFEVSAEMLNTGQLSLSIANVGSNNAEAVVVRIPKQQGIRVSGSDTAILGNLNRGDFTMANFQIELMSFDQNNLNGLGEGFRDMRAKQQTQEREETQEGGAFEGTRTANTLLIEIDYTDTTGERQSVQKTIHLSPSSLGIPGATFLSRGQSQEDNLFSFIPSILLVLIVGGAIAFNRFKAGNKEWKRLRKVIAVIIVLFLAVIFLLGSDLLVTAIATVVSLALLVWFFRKKQKE